MRGRSVKTAAKLRSICVVTVANQVGRYLAHLDVGHVFGVVGSGNFEITNALRTAGVPYTAARHEGGAATMADSYARMSGKVGVVSVHQGCGLTNAGTGISEAAKSRSPIIVLAAEAPAHLIHSNFSMDQRDYARSLLATPVRVNSAETALADTLRAYKTALRERRAVVLNLPTNVQAQEAIGEIPQAKVGRKPDLIPATDEVAALAEAIKNSSRPVFVAGRGGREARAEIMELAQHTGALVATSAVAKGLFNADPVNLGISGGFSSPTTAALIADADLIVSFGCALNMWTMRHGKLIDAGATVGQIDIDDNALGAHRPIDIGVLGSSAATASALLEALQQEGGTRYRTQDVQQQIATRARWDQTPTEDISITGTSIDPRELTKAVNAMLPEERV